MDALLYWKQFKSEKENIKHKDKIEIYIYI